MSQLHKRLQHLVHYSSQLIFVSSDSIADQQRTLSQFLSLQQESTEVSFFSADKTQSNSDYRRIICRQLANHQVGSFVRSLKELLGDLEPERAQYLVCISQAQLLQKEFVEELWQWISACRQRYDGLHVNVILFAEQAWTEKTQAWLPSHNDNNPVLLSSQSVDAVGFDVSALENLMAQQRAFFTADTAHSIIRKKWFIASVLIAFFAIFAALMAIQYPEQIKHAFKHGSFPAESHDNAEAPQSLGVSEANVEYQPKIEIVAPSLTDNILVSNWPDEVSSPAILNNDTSDKLPGEPLPSAPIPSIPEEKTALTTEQATDDSIGNPTSTKELNSEPSTDQTTEAIIEENTTERRSPEQDISTLSAYEFNELALLQLSQSQFAVQLSGIQNRQVLEEYLQDNELRKNTWIYRTQRYGSDWFVVLLNESFSSLNEANSAIQQLPTAIRRGGPFAKRISQVKQEIQNATN